METLPDEKLSLYWQQEYANEWQRHFESTQNKKLLLQQVLHHLPHDLGRLEFLEDMPGERFIVLITYDENSEDGRENAAQIFFTLAETRSIIFFGQEAAWREVELEWLRVFPDKEILKRVAKDKFDSFDFAPLEYAALICEKAITLWGIEDEKLYKDAVKAHNDASPQYSDIIRRRVPVMFENLLLKMSELGVTIAGASVTDYTFSAGREWLREKHIGHAGIRASSSGRSMRWDVDAAIRGEVVDPFRKILEESMGGAEASISEETTAETKPLIDREKSLAFSLEQRVEALKETDRRLNKNWLRRFGELGVLPAETAFDWTLAAAVWGDPMQNPDLTDSTLEALYHHAILARDPRTGRYYVYPGVYAHVPSQSAAGLETARDRYRAYVINLAEQFQYLPLRAQNALVPDWSHLQFVGHDLAKSVEKLLGNLEPLAEAEPASLPAPGELTEVDRHLLVTASDFAAAIRRYVAIHRNIGESGRLWLKLGLVSARMLHQQYRIALFLNDLGAWHIWRSQYQVGRCYLEQALTIRREMGDRAGEGETLNNLGSSCMLARQPEQALELLEQALVIMREDSDRTGEATTLLNLAAVYSSMKQPERSRELLEQALAISREIGQRANEALILMNLGWLLHNDLRHAADGISSVQQAAHILEAYCLPQTAGGQTPEQLRALLATMRLGCRGYLGNLVARVFSMSLLSLKRLTKTNADKVIYKEFKGSVNAWVVSTLTWLPLLLMVLGHSLGTMPTTILGIGFNRLLLGGLILVWVGQGLSGTKLYNRTKQDTLHLAGLMAFVMAGAVVYSLASDLALSLSGGILVGGAVGLAMGMAGGLTRDVKRDPISILVIGLAAVLAVTVGGITTFSLEGDLIRAIAGVVAFLITFVVAYFVMFVVLVFVVGTIVAIGVGLGLGGVAAIGLLSGTVVSLISGMASGVAVGLAYVLAITVASIMQKQIEGQRLSWLSKGILLIALPLSYGVLAWIYLLRGWSMLGQ